LGEEIAWRAFFQKQMTRVMPMVPVLAISAVLFALGHFTSDSLVLVLFNLAFIATNSVVFGIIFHKTKNAWVSGIAHFLGNILIYVVMILI
jgi:membrane protease YdiL (CAAX protease family)